MSHADWMIEKELDERLDGPNSVVAELSALDLVRREYKFILFELDHFVSRPVWICRNKRHRYELGEVKWYTSWRRYCMFTDRIVLSERCAADVSDFLKRLTEWEASR